MQRTGVFKDAPQSWTLIHSRFYANEFTSRTGKQRKPRLYQSANIARSWLGNGISNRARCLYHLVYTGSRALSGHTFCRLNTAYYSQSARGVSCCAHMASRMGRLHSLRQSERERRFKAWTIAARQIFRRFDRRANAKRGSSVTGADSRDLFPCARLLPVESHPVSLEVATIRQTDSRRIPRRSNFRVIATDLSNDGRVSTFISLFLSMGNTRSRVDRLVADRAMNAGGKKIEIVIAFDA